MVLPLGAIGVIITWSHDFDNLANLDISSYGWASFLNSSREFETFSYLQLWTD